jgi:DnaJ-class molecular chaperone
VDSGQRFMGWVSAQHVHVPKCGRCKGAGWLVSNGAATHVCTICRGSGRAASP